MQTSTSSAADEHEQRPRILVADDDPGTLALTHDVLTFGGFDVVVARDGQEALELARQSAPDLALLDVMMPGIDGCEVCRRLRADARFPDIPILLFSAADEVQVKWSEAGADGFVRKPFRVRQLTREIRRRLGNGNGASPTE